MDTYEFKHPNNRVRLEGRLVTMPEEYFKSHSGTMTYKSYINVPVKLKYCERENIIPLTLKQSAVDIIKSKFSVGDKITVYGAFDRKVIKTTNENGSTSAEFLEHLKTQTIFRTRKEHLNNNVGAVRGVLTKDPEIISLPGKPDFAELTLKVNMYEQENSAPITSIINLNVTEAHLFRKIELMREGDPLAAKIMLKSMSSVKRTKVRGMVLYFLNPDHLDADKTFDLDYQSPPQNDFTK